MVFFHTLILPSLRKNGGRKFSLECGGRGTGALSGFPATPLWYLQLIA